MNTEKRYKYPIIINRKYVSADRLISDVIDDVTKNTCIIMNIKGDMLETGTFTGLPSRANNGFIIWRLEENKFRISFNNDKEMFFKEVNIEEMIQIIESKL